MIYTIGYQRLTPQRILEIATRLDAVVVDVRARPVSRKAGFSAKALTQAFGSRYFWMGDVLGGAPWGGKSNVTKAGIKRIGAAHESNVKHAILMCMEDAPGDCHRHSDICAPHFHSAIHIFEDELITAGELQRAIDEDDDGFLHGSLSALLDLPVSA